VPAAVLDELQRRRLSWQARVAHWAATNGTFSGLVEFEAYRAHCQRYPAEKFNRSVVYRTTLALVRPFALVTLRLSNRLFKTG
jgi:hypothetical protein